MFDRKQLEDAINYNESINSYSHVLLPWPWCDSSTVAFELWTAIFQSENGLKSDGKMGANTLDKINSLNDTAAVKIEDLKHTSPSNNIVIGGKLVKIPQALICLGFTATNYLEDGEPKFNTVKSNGKPLQYYVQHETCGNTAEGCKKSLIRKGFGVQLIMSPDKKLSCHGDLKLDRMTHANQLNKRSTGIEFVNPYNPVYVSNSEVFGRTISKQWWTWVPNKKDVSKLLEKKGWKSVPNEYVLPTDSQLKFLEIFTPWVCEKIGVPYVFPTIGKRGKERFPDAGVVPHRAFSNHSDGQYLVEHLAGKK